MQSQELPTETEVMRVERVAAQESLESGIYITFTPGPSCDLRNSSIADEVKNGTGQCCRIGSQSICACGHPLSAHASIKPKRGYIKPPSCKSCRCSTFAYLPWWPEECGQWWLKRRGGKFDINQWRQVGTEQRRQIVASS